MMEPLRKRIDEWLRELECRNHLRLDVLAAIMQAVEEDRAAASDWMTEAQKWKLECAKAEAREVALRTALELACRLMGHADIDWPESIDAALAKEGK